MNTILSIVYPFGHFSFALLEWILFGWTIRLWLRSTSLAMIILSIVLVSLSYDNLVLAMGSLIGSGKLLKTLNMARFAVHYLVLPLFIAIGVELAHRAGAIWANRLTRVLSWAVVVGLAWFGIVNNYIRLELDPVKFAGVLRYTIVNVDGPPIISIVVNLFVLLIGIGLWFRLKWRWLFVGTFISFIGNAIPSSLVGTLVGSASEFVMAFSLLLTEQRTQFVLNQLALDDKPNDIVDPKNWTGS